jgi:hypothetical protein
MVVALAAALVLCLATGVSWASRGIGVESGGRLVTFTSERLVFELEGTRVTCPITLTGSFSSFAKMETNLIGPIVSASLPERSCTGGSARILTGTLPWEFEYFSFSGTLPRISSLTLGIEELSALVEFLGIGCLVRGTPRAITGGGTEVRELRIDETVRIPVATRLSVFCPSEGSLSGTFRVSPTVRLSLQESLPGSSISAEPNPLTIPAANPNGVFRLRAVGGEVDTGRIRRILNTPEEPNFTVSGCEQTHIASGGVCSVTVTKAGRPSGGTVAISYRNNQGELFRPGISVVIQ